MARLVASASRATGKLACLMTAPESFLKASSATDERAVIRALIGRNQRGEAAATFLPFYATGLLVPRRQEFFLQPAPCWARLPVDTLNLVLSQGAHFLQIVLVEIATLGDPSDRAANPRLLSVKRPDNRFLFLRRQSPVPPNGFALESWWANTNRAIYLPCVALLHRSDAHVQHAKSLR
ncbi:MAG TPA: hypothetical protein VG900_06100 [Hyphomicrobiaceae bacterium]|nr:hypothetical protein [Hyphomicrobiaceae bacterium]